MTTGLATKNANGLAYRTQDKTAIYDSSCCGVCIYGDTVSLNTCKNPGDFLGDFPDVWFYEAQRSPMCVRALIWHKTRYDHATGKIIRTDTSAEIAENNHDYCYRMGRWCGAPILRSVGNDGGAIYNEASATPQTRPFVTPCWDIATQTPRAIGVSTFTVEDVPWVETNCAPPTTDVFFAPLFASITAQLGAGDDGMRIAILVVASAEKWQHVRRAAVEQPPWTERTIYSEPSGYSGSITALKFHQCSAESELWDATTGDIGVCD